MNKSKNTKQSGTDKEQYMSRTSLILMPLLVLILCIAIAIPVLIRPYEKISTFTKIAFMDDMKTSGSSSLEIVNAEISKEYDGETYSDGEVVIPKFGEQYAALEIESIGLYVPVYWGSNAELLELGAVQSTSSTAAGSGGNVVIDAHVNTFFNELDKAVVGDKVTLYTQYGRFTYEVSELIEFRASDKKYVLPAKEEKLTLYTCEMQVFGSSEKRIGVVCKPVEMIYYNQKEAE
ncbi:MAG: class D sortase [Ruminococcus sp.]|nr:class D sortase [Ruminococcus sp.]